jgi:hypothetical protein
MYDTKRPSKKVLEGLFAWLAENQVHLYTGSADLDTGQQHTSLMDVTSADDLIKIYEHNQNDTWILPEGY